MDYTGRLFDDLIVAAPGLALVHAEHLADHGEVLPHVLMGDVLPWLAASALEPGDAPWVRAVLDVLEAHMTAGTDGAQEVIVLSFLEGLGAGECHAGERVLCALLGPRLRAALDGMGAG